MKKQQIDKIKNWDLSAFDAKLRDMADEGIFDGSMEEHLDRLLREAEPTELTDNEQDRLYQTIKKASDKNAILDARRVTPLGGLPFGRYLQLIRDKCELTKEDVARLLNKNVIYVDKIETGQTSPLRLLSKEVADIMQLFRLTVSELKSTIKSFLSLADLKQSKTSAMARSSIKAGTKGQEDSLGFAMDAALQAIAKKKNI